MQDIQIHGRKSAPAYGRKAKSTAFHTASVLNTMWICTHRQWFKIKKPLYFQALINTITHESLHDIICKIQDDDASAKLDTIRVKTIRHKFKHKSYMSLRRFGL